MTERDILKTTKALLVRAFILVFGFAGNFLWFCALRRFFSFFLGGGGFQFLIGPYANL